MGYRSTFVTEDIYYKLPDWFVEKYKDRLSFGSKNSEDLDEYTFPLAATYERKFYSGAEDELFIDIAKYLREVRDAGESYPRQVVLVLLHEDGEVDRVIIEPDKIKLEGSLKYDPEDCYNPQLGDRDAEYIIPKETDK